MLDTTIGRKVDDPDKMAEISDKVVSKMKERGMIESAPSEEGNGGTSGGRRGRGPGRE